MKNIENKGGDGTVPTWSPLLTAFKWIYEKQKNTEYTQSINLVEYCSRLAADKTLDLPNFIPLSCRCLEGNVYKSDLKSCSHQSMLADTNLHEYIFGEISKDNKDINAIKLIVETYNDKKDYLKECNNQLYRFVNADGKIKCSDDIEITEEEYANSFCSKQSYVAMKGRKCCSIHVYGHTDEKKEFNGYYCDNVDPGKIDDYEKGIKDMRLFTDNEYIDKVYVDCLSYYLKEISKKVLLLISLLLF